MNGLDTSAAEAIVRSPSLTTLGALFLNSNPIGAAGRKAIRRSTILTSLRRFEARNTDSPDPAKGGKKQ